MKILILSILTIVFLLLLVGFLYIERKVKPTDEGSRAPERRNGHGWIP